MDIPYGEPSFEISEMIGKNFLRVTNIEDKILEFLAENSDRYIFYHYQDCCESVTIEDIVGNLSDLEGSPILEAEQSEGETRVDEYGESCTWTFYKFGTIKGHVNVRWYGTSNGYYSESVHLTIIKAKKDEVP